jgi:hypothetical protein
VRYVLEQVTVAKQAAVETDSVEDVMVAAAVWRLIDRAKPHFAVLLIRARHLRPGELDQV